MLERPYSFVAVRDGASLASQEIELEPVQKLPPSPRRRVVVLENGADRFIVDGLSRTSAELKEALAQVIKADRATEVLLRVPAAVPFERVSSAARGIREAGATTIRVGPADDR